MNVDLRDQGTIFFRHAGTAPRTTQPDEGLSASLTAGRTRARAGGLGKPAGNLSEGTQRGSSRAHRGGAESRSPPRSGHFFRDGRHRSASVKWKRGRCQHRAGPAIPLPAVVNCAGAWAGQLPPHRFPTRPVKGQMLSVGRRIARSGASRHSRSRNLSGSAQRRPHSGGSDGGGSGIRQAHRRGHDPAHASGGDPPDSRSAPRRACWKPGRDCGQVLPIICPSSAPPRTPGYFVATGHFRDGILLAPVTAQLHGATGHWWQT